MNDVTTFRLYLLRGTYLLLVVGLAMDIWPLLLHATNNVEHMRGVVWSLLGAMSLVAVLGIRYPLKMLPLLFFELTWKTIWVLAIGLPLWSQNRLTAATRDTWFACLMGVVIVTLAIPWKFAFVNYVRRPGDRWGRLPRSASTPAGDTVPPRHLAH